MHLYHTLQGAGSLSLNLFEVCGMAGATPIELCRDQGHFYEVFLRFVEWQVQPLSHSEGIMVSFT